MYTGVYVVDLKRFIFVYMDVLPACLCAVLMDARRGIRSLELELQEVLTHLWVLGLQLQPSE